MASLLKMSAASPLPSCSPSVIFLLTKFEKKFIIVGLITAINICEVKIMESGNGNGAKPKPRSRKMDITVISVVSL